MKVHAIVLFLVFSLPSFSMDPPANNLKFLEEKRNTYSSATKKKFRQDISRGRESSVVDIARRHPELLEIPKHGYLYPLGIAIKSRNESMIKTLIRVGASLAATNVVLGENKHEVVTRSMLGLAYDNSLYKIAEFFIERGAVLRKDEEEFFGEMRDKSLQEIAKRRS